MDRLREMEIFVQTVESGSLSAAARALNLSVAVVSKEMARLERRLGARLLTRTTRHLALTAEGEMFFTRSVRLLADLAEAEAQAGQTAQVVDGPLRVTAPAAFGRRHVAPLLADLAARHPGLRPHLDLTDRIVTLAEENMDMAVRFGALTDPGLISRRIADNDRVICASPAYLQQHEPPRTPDDLTAHAMLLIGPDSQRTFRFAGPGGRAASVRLSARLSSTNGDVVQDWALAGLGLEVKSWWDVAEDLAQGRLVRVLSDWRMPDSGMHVVFPAGRHRPYRVRLLAEALEQRLTALAGQMAVP